MLLTASPRNTFPWLSRAPMIWPLFNFLTLLLTAPQDACTFLFGQAVLSWSPPQLPKSNCCRPTVLMLSSHAGIPPSTPPSPSQHIPPKSCLFFHSSINNPSAWLFPMTMVHLAQGDQENWVFGI